MFENIRADLKTYGGDWTRQGFWVMIVYRFGRWRYTLRNTLARKCCSFFYKFLYKAIQVLTGIELPCEVPVGRNFRIDHFGYVVVSGFAKFGDHCILRSGVVVGLQRTDEPGAPIIGNNVDVGTGAKLLGRITIGNNVLIGANSVVITDVPDNSIAVGVPARIIPRKPEQ